uniref:Uncharacterized protein n=1 Tax=Nothobranchius rachovii TaxID=451742 RepID=A0A1A8NCH6_9TELE
MVRGLGLASAHVDGIVKSSNAEHPFRANELQRGKGGQDIPTSCGLQKTCFPYKDETSSCCRTVEQCCEGRHEQKAASRCVRDPCIKGASCWDHEEVLAASVDLNKRCQSSTCHLTPLFLNEGSESFLSSMRCE